MVTSTELRFDQQVDRVGQSICKSRFIPGHPCRHLRRFATWPQFSLNLVRKSGKTAAKNRANSRWAMHPTARRTSRSDQRSAQVSLCASPRSGRGRLSYRRPRMGIPRASPMIGPKAINVAKVAGSSSVSLCGQSPQATHWTTPVSVKPMATGGSGDEDPGTKKHDLKRQPHP